MWDDGDKNERQKNVRFRKALSPILLLLVPKMRKEHCDVSQETGALSLTGFEVLEVIFESG